VETKAVKVGKKKDRDEQIRGGCQTGTNHFVSGLQDLFSKGSTVTSACSRQVCGHR